MEIVYNNDKVRIEPDSTLSDFIKSQNISVQKGIALAVNYEVIPQSNWQKFKLKQNDELIVVQATQGG